MLFTYFILAAAFIAVCVLFYVLFFDMNTHIETDSDFEPEQIIVTTNKEPIVVQGTPKVVVSKINQSRIGYVQPTVYVITDDDDDNGGIEDAEFVEIDPTMIIDEPIQNTYIEPAPLTEISDNYINQVQDVVSPEPVQSNWVNTPAQEIYTVPSEPVQSNWMSSPVQESYTPPPPAYEAPTYTPAYYEAPSHTPPAYDPPSYQPDTSYTPDTSGSSVSFD